MTDERRTPAIAAVVNAACGGCKAPLPEFVIEGLNGGAAVVCARCRRVLHLARPVE